MLEGLGIRYPRNIAKITSATCPSCLGSTRTSDICRRVVTGASVTVGGGSPADLRLVSPAIRRTVESVQRPRPDPHFRGYSLAPGCPIELEVHCADGSVAYVRGVVDRVPWLAGEIAQRVVIVDAVARPLPADVRGAA
jgi:hypothetical protein